MTGSSKHLKNLIEAALFMSPKALSLKDLMKVARGYKEEEIINALEDLKEDYLKRESAIQILFSSFGYQMTVKPDYEDRVIHLAASTSFNKSIMRTLALIAFKEPIKQSDLIKLRNNKAYDHISLLEAKGFIERKKQGKSYLITTTKKFKKTFGPQSLKLKQVKPFSFSHS